MSIHILLQRCYNNSNLNEDRWVYRNGFSFLICYTQPLHFVLLLILEKWRSKFRLFSATNTCTWRGGAPTVSDSTFHFPSLSFHCAPVHTSARSSHISSFLFSPVSVTWWLHQLPTITGGSLSVVKLYVSSGLSCFIRLRFWAARHTAWPAADKVKNVTGRELLLIWLNCFMRRMLWKYVLDIRSYFNHFKPVVRI